MKKLWNILSIGCLALVLTACGDVKTIQGTETSTEKTEKIETEMIKTTEANRDENETDASQQQIQQPAQPPSASQQETQPASPKAPETTQQPESQSQAQEQNHEAPADWNGTFSKGDEQVVLAAADSTSFEFQFASSGIAGVARVKESPNSATFTGDDNNIIVFTLNGDTLNVSVLDPESSAAASSVLNGTYTLQKQETLWYDDGVHLAVKVRSLEQSKNFYGKLGFQQNGEGYLDTPEGRMEIVFLPSKDQMKKKQKLIRKNKKIEKMLDFLWTLIV